MQKTQLAHFFAQNCSFAVNFKSLSTFVVAHDGKQVIFAFEYKTGQARRGDFIEIYNVCTLTAMRRQGVARRVLAEFIQSKHDNYTLWLGILLDKTAPFKLYTSLGFTNPRLTNKSPLGNVQAFRFISLIYNPFTDANDKKVAEKECKHIVDALADASTMKRGELVLNYSIFEQSRVNLVDEEVEMGGELRVLADQSLHIASIYRGSPNSLSVSFPYAPIIYHTHPIHAYKITNYGVGTPSAPDFQVSANPLVSIHLVISMEGSYIIQYSSDFRMLSTYLSIFYPKCYQGLEQVIYKLFSEEYFRHIAYITGPLLEKVPVKILSISRDFKQRVKSIVKDYITHINSMTLRDILRSSTNTLFNQCVHDFTDILDYNICRLVFIPQSDIDHKVLNKQNIIIPEIKM